jgi:hypothetical protein
VVGKKSLPVIKNGTKSRKSKLNDMYFVGTNTIEMVGKLKALKKEL